MPDGSAPPDLPPNAGDNVADFHPAIVDSIQTTVVASLAQKTHMMLYHKDEWGEPASIRLLGHIAQTLDLEILALDIPDLAWLTAGLDPIFGELTVVSYSYEPSPELMPKQEDADSEELDEEDGETDQFYNGFNTADNGTIESSIEVEADVSDAKSPTGPSYSRVRDSQRLPLPMMENPLSRETTKRLDVILDGLLASNTTATAARTDDPGVPAKPKIIVLKHVSDLLNTRIGYTLFARLVAAAERHNSGVLCRSSGDQLFQNALPSSLVQKRPVMLVGLVHPSIFNPTVPPPTIPPFDIPPSTPVAMHQSDASPE
ncbi:hypothetical protein EV182_006717, partial [Spiromyces aspiralis]